MNTKQHSALFALGLFEKTWSYETFRETLNKELPYALLPDGIRAYIGARQAGHYEETPDGTDTSYLIYPDADILKSLTKETAPHNIVYYVANGYRKCVIGEETQIHEFDKRNWSHPHFHALRTHMVQDYIFDAFLRQLVDVTGRFKEDGKGDFKIVSSGQRIDGAKLREQVALLEDLGFLKLVGAVYRKTGLLLNREWFDDIVFSALNDAYPEDLAANTYKYMRISDDVNERINAKKFAFTDAEKKSIILTDDLNGELDRLYTNAYLATFDQL